MGGWIGKGWMDKGRGGWMDRGLSAKQLQANCVFPADVSAFSF